MDLQHADVYRYCVVLACGDESLARSATEAAPPGAAGFGAARDAVREGLRQRPVPAAPTGDDAARALYSARPLIEEHHWNLLALVVPEYSARPRHRQVDLTGVAAVLGKKADVTRKAVDRLVGPGGLLELALFAAAAAADPSTGCPDLPAVIAAAGTKRLRPAVRKAVAAHLPTCATCTSAQRARPTALAVLSEFPLPEAPADLTEPGDVPDPAGLTTPDVLVSAGLTEPDGPDPAGLTEPDGPDPAGLTESDGPVPVPAALGAPDVPAPAEHADLATPALMPVPSPVPSPVPWPVSSPVAELDADDITVELSPGPEPAVYRTTPAVPVARLPLLRRPPVLLAVVLLVLLGGAAVAGIAGLRGGTPKGQAAANSATTPAAPPSTVAAPGVLVPASPSAGRTPAASGHAKPSTAPSASPAASVSAAGGVPLVPAADRLREVLPLVVKAPGCPGQTFGGSCYSIQPFTLPLEVAVPAGFDEARLADALQWTVRTETVLGPVAFHGRGNHARVRVTDSGQATPPTVWVVQAALTVNGQTHLSDEVTLRVYATA
ncbi:hypothetical protein [Dactylosporangium sp. NPDC000521]|uniref:hypothetical protein n=1 Tax=Dactylosporangium sp. NPDC000521 TaxID=3363975 RepID=UPI0036CA5321